MLVRDRGRARHICRRELDLLTVRRGRLTGQTRNLWTTPCRARPTLVSVRPSPRFPTVDSPARQQPVAPPTRPFDPPVDLGRCGNQGESATVLGPPGHP